MSIKVAKTRFIVPPLSKHAGFYQHLLTSALSFQELGNRLVHRAEVAFAFRQTDTLDEVGTILSNLPLKEYQLIGQYFRAWCAYERGEDTQSQLEHVFTHSRTFKARALISLAAIKARGGDYDAEIECFNDSMKLASDLTTLVKAAKGIAVAKAKQGYDQGSLKDLEKISPLIHHASPDVYYDCLNSLAVELGTVGRKYEARNIIKHVIASSFAIAYPEWQETARDLREPNRSFVTVPSIQRQPVEPKHVETPKPVIKPKQPASVLSFPKLKEVPLPEKPEKVSQQDVEDMDLTEMRETIMAAIRSGAIPESEYKRMMYMHGLVKNSPASKVIDLEDEALLADIIIEWCNMIEPEQFTAVMSALRDCKDDYRRDVSGTNADGEFTLNEGAIRAEGQGYRLRSIRGRR